MVACVEPETFFMDWHRHGWPFWDTWIIQRTKCVYTMLVQYSFQCSHVTFLWRCPNFLDQITILPKHASYLSLTLTSSIQQRSLLFSEKFYALYFCYCRTFPSLLELGLWSGKLVLGQAYHFTHCKQTILNVLWMCLRDLCVNRKPQMHDS